MDNHKELEKLYQSIWEGITLTKSLFKEVIIYINDNKITSNEVSFKISCFYVETL